MQCLNPPQWSGLFYILNGKDSQRHLENTAVYLFTVGCNMTGPVSRMDTTAMGECASAHRGFVEHSWFNKSRKQRQRKKEDCITLEGEQQKQHMHTIKLWDKNLSSNKSWIPARSQDFLSNITARCSLQIGVILTWKWYNQPLESKQQPTQPQDFQGKVFESLSSQSLSDWWVVSLSLKLHWKWRSSLWK